jgi:4-hydroxybenzoate polyprenyltransferase
LSYLRALAALLAYSHAWLGFGITSLCYTTHFFLALPGRPHPLFLLMIFAAVLFLYNLHYFPHHNGSPFSDRALWQQSHRRLSRLLITGCGLIAAACFVYLLLTHPRPLHTALLTIGCALGACAYSFPLLPLGSNGQLQRIRDTGWLKLPWLAACLTAITILLPVAFTGHTPETAPAGNLLLFNRFGFFFLLGLLFDLRDTATDARRGLHTLPVWLGKGPTALFLFIALPLEVLTYLSLLEKVYPSKILLPMAICLAFITLLLLLRLLKTSRHLPYLLLGDGLILLKSAATFAACILFR